MRTAQLAGLALALTMGGAGLASAQNTAQTPATPPAAQVTAPRHHRHFARRALFHDVKLTPDQRTQLKRMRERFRNDAKPLMEQFRAERRDLRQAKQSGDSAALTAARSKLDATRAQMKPLREQFLTETRSVLTPDQQAQFDKNVAAMKTRWERHQAHKQS